MAKIPLGVRISPDLMRRLKEFAREENRTVSNLVDTALERYVERRKSEKAK